jgi:iron(III) transport system substrate-binding protein
MRRTAMTLAVVGLIALAGCASSEESISTDDESPSLTVYSGRSEELIAGLIDQFETSSGTEVSVRYGDTAELAAQLLEEGANTPADVFFAQDAGALQVMQDEELTAELPASTVAVVPAQYRSADDQWVGTSGRARVVVYNTDAVSADQIPDTVAELTEPQWRARVGIAPTNASFQSFVTALRKTQGEEAARQWLVDLQANDVQSFENNAAILDAVDAGQVDVGLVNHYYWYEKADEVGEQNMSSANAAFAPGDPGNLVNVAGVAVTQEGSDNPAATAFVEFLLSPAAQQYFATQTSEYPLTDSAEPRAGLAPLAQIEGPDLGLEQLSDLRGTQDVLIQVGLL